MHRQRKNQRDLVAFFLCYVLVNVHDNPCPLSTLVSNTVFRTVHFELRRSDVVLRNLKGRFVPAASSVSSE